MLINRLLAFFILSTLASNSPAQATKEAERIPPATDANPLFTPLVLPADAAERGISLSGDTKMYRIQQGQYNLGSGCALIHTEEPISIKTCRADIFARTGATIVVGAKKDVTRILNLSDRKHDSVRVIFGKYHISLNPGEELAVISSRASNLDKAANEYVIRYRNAQTISVSSEYDAVLFEFSLADAMQHCLIFKQLRESPRNEDHALLQEIIKTAAAVNTMYAKSRDKYTHGDDKTVVAKHTSKRIAKSKQARLALNADNSNE